MEWSRSDLRSLARWSCTTCWGEGKKTENNGDIVPCFCVLRAVFRACYARFRVAATRGKSMSRVSFEHFGGRERRIMWCRKDEEYVADFHLVSRRVLEPGLYRIFCYHYLLGADWRLCCQRLRLDRGRFFHAVYRIQETLGRVFYELQPYGLYPPRIYFVTYISGGVRRKVPVTTKPAAEPELAGMVE